MSETQNLQLTDEQIKEKYGSLAVPHHKEEREVIITFNEAEGYWEAYSTSPRFIRKFLKKGWEVKNVEHFSDGTLCSMTFIAPIYGLRIMNPQNVKRNISEEEKEVLRKRLEAIRERKNLV